ncbi:MAG TPA: hypothetical protein VG248_10600 [Caulobacteraceae bacterium]|nr:hypothetical protein [Caulobacteraceae bacterium]
METQLILREAIAASAIAVLGAVAFLLGVTLLQRRREGREDGWTVLEPGLLPIALGALSLAGVIAFLAVDIGRILRPDPAPEGGWPFDVAFAACSGLFAWAALGAFAVQWRFNDDGVERRGLGAPTFIAWTQLAAVRSTALRGPVLVTAAGGAMAVSEYLNGFRHLLVAAAGKGASVDAGLTRKFRLGARA